MFSSQLGESLAKHLYVKVAFFSRVVVFPSSPSSFQGIAENNFIALIYWESTILGRAASARMP